MKVRPTFGRQVAVRVEAFLCDYSNNGAVFGNRNRPGPGGGAGPRAVIPGDSQIGTVVEIGPQVQGIQVGDRVIVAVAGQCGRCYHCLKGRADRCQVVTEPDVQIGELADGTPVFQGGGSGGKGSYAEYSIVYEDLCVPIFSDVSSDELCLLTCSGTTGLGMTMTLAPVFPGADVVVFGAGPVGLSAVQGARIMGARQIIAIEPIKFRRDLALKLGATAAIDPNVDGGHLVERLRDMCKGSTDRKFAGGKDQRTGFDRGPDFVIEAVGGETMVPKAERGPDPTGLLSLQQAYDVCPSGGHMLMTGVGYPAGANFTVPAGQFTNNSKTIHSCRYGGVSSHRDLPRFVKLIENGLYDAKSMITAKFSFDQVLEGSQYAADRVGMAAIVTFS